MSSQKTTRQTASLKMQVCKETRTIEDYLSAEMLSVNLLYTHSGCDRLKTNNRLVQGNVLSYLIFLFVAVFV